VKNDARISGTARAHVLENVSTKGHELSGAKLSMGTICNLTALFGLALVLLCTTASASTFTNLYIFSADAFGSGADTFDFDGTNASRPYSTPALSGNTLFGISLFKAASTTVATLFEPIPPTFFTALQRLLMYLRK
jgi:hypothetical protein